MIDLLLLLLLEEEEDGSSKTHKSGLYLPSKSSGSSGSPASRTISGAGDGSSIRAGAGIGDRQVRDGRTGAGIGTGASTLGRSDALSAKVALGVGGTDAAGGTRDT